MKHFLLFIFTFVCISSAGIASSHSAEIYKSTDQDRQPILAYIGPTVPGDAQKLLVLVEANPKIKRIMMAGPGGVLNEGIFIGRIIQKYNLYPHVPKGLPCISACAFALMAADEGFIDGIIGIHTPYVQSDVAMDRTLNDLLISTSMSSLRNAKLFYDMGYKYSLLMTTYALTSQSDTIVFKRFHELLEYRFDRNKDGAEWEDTNEFQDVWLKSRTYTPEKVNQYIVAQRATMGVK